MYNTVIENLDLAYNDINSRIGNYVMDYKQAIDTFIKEHNLDKDVAVIANGKEIRGVLRVNTNNVINVRMPYSVDFYPYKKDGTVSLQRRVLPGFYVTCAPSEYFNKLLENYKPVE